MIFRICLEQFKLFKYTYSDLKRLLIYYRKKYTNINASSTKAISCSLANFLRSLRDKSDPLVAYKSTEVVKQNPKYSLDYESSKRVNIDLYSNVTTLDYIFFVIYF